MESIFTKLSWLIGNGYSYKEIQQKMVTSLRGEIEVNKLKGAKWNGNNKICRI